MKEIVFHIGTPKTGTSTIQHTLGRSRDAFQALGIYYPNAARIGREGHHNLVYELVSQWKYKPHLGGWDVLEAELRDRDEDIILISSESLSGYRQQPVIPERCLKLAGALNRRARVVAYVRPQYAYLESIYAQNASTGYTSLKFDRYLLESIASDAADYGAILHNWQAQFGQCEVLPFDPQPGSPLVSRMIRSLFAITLPDSIVEHRTNDRRGVRAVEFARKASETTERMGKPIGERTALAKRVSDICSRRFPKEPRFSGMDSDLIKTVQALFADKNAALFATFPAIEEAFARISAKPGKARNIMDIDAAGLKLRDEYFTVLHEALQS